MKKGVNFMQIIVYSTTSCPYCKILKNYLIEKNISFTEKLVDQDDSAREEMSQISGGFLGVPFTLVIKDDGTRSTIIGFDKSRLDNILGLD